MNEFIRDDGSFNFWVPATIKKGSDGKMWVSGIASTEHEDLQGEKIKQEGIDLSYFLARGFLNDDHSKETGGKVGIPTEGKITKNGLWIKGYLLDTPRAKAIYDLATALNKAGGERQLGYSVEGKVLQRDSRNPKVITKCWLKDVAITASPINPHSFLELAKSLNGSDCTQIFVTGETEEVVKGNVVSQQEEEKKDADRTAQDALAIAPDGTPKKKDMEKELKDVPLAKKTFKSLTLDDKVTLEFTDEGVLIKGVYKDSEGQTLLKLPKHETNHAENPCQECGSAEDCEHKTDMFPKLNIKQGAEIKEIKEATDWKPVHKPLSSAVKSMSGHSQDAHCDVNSSTGLCNGCGVAHFGDACKTCGGKGYHEATCTEPSTPWAEAGPSFVGKSSSKCNCCDKCTGKAGCKCCDKCNMAKCMDKAENDTDLEKSDKGFKKIHEVGGEREYGSKRVPLHSTTYKHGNGNHIIVTGDGNAYSVIHAHDKSGKTENYGSHIFYDDPAKGKKAKDDCDNHLKGYGIDHRFCDKKAMLGKALVTAQDDNNCCDLCGNNIQKGDHFIIKSGYTFDNYECVEKALIAGYQFGVTDQTNGSALRVESLEGSQKDTSYGGHLDVIVKDVKFDTARANGGKTSVTLRDAVDYLTARGLSMGQADRLLILLVNNGYDLSKIANAVK